MVRSSILTNLVGVVTGDVNLNPEASCVIMTTEILRNMLYRGVDAIKNIEWVIFDEIHYINNDQRGVVWEESIIMLPDHIGIVMLSATVENVMDFAEWVGRITSRKIFVQYTDKRPVPLEHWMYHEGNLKILKTKEGVFHRQDYENYLKSLKNKKKDNNKMRERKKEEMYSKLDELSKKGNQRERVRKITGASKKHQKGEYLVMKQMMQQGSIPKPRLPEMEGIVKLIHTLKKEDMLPAICFVFSKKKLTSMVEELEKQITLVTGEERKQIREFYHRAISRLKPNDQAIYQLQMLKNVLLKGIGIHHGDLLHIGKEVVEILLQKGLVKMLFATDSFAMGLNMPTKTVVFNGIKKFDGKELRYLLGSEYTQMSGRAGRRGLDDRGKVIAFFTMERDLPTPIEYEEMCGSKGESLKSKFKMSYSILFNALSSQIVELEDIMKKSFGENTNVLAIKDLKKKRDDLLKALEKQKVECPFVNIEDNAPIDEYRQTGDQLYDTSSQFFSRVHVANDMRLNKFAFIVDSNYNIFLVLLQRYNKDYKDKDFIFHYDGLIVRKANDKSPGPVLVDAPEKNIVYHNGLPWIEKYECKIQPMEIMIVFHNPRPIYVDRLDDDDLVEEFEAYHKLIMKGKVRPMIYPSCKSPDAVELLSAVEANYMALMSNKCNSCHLKSEHINFVYGITEKQKEYTKVEAEIKKSEVLFGFHECEAMLNILRELGYINENNLPQLKTRVARELGGGGENLFITELIMDNVLDPLKDEEIAPLVSIFVAQGKSKDEVNIEELGVPETLVDALNKSKAIFDKIKAMEVTNEIETEESLNFQMVKPIYEWAKGRDFVEIMAHTEVLEGALVRTIQRVEQTMRNIKRALVLVGNTTMVEKADRSADLIKRDIAFFLSLYIDQSKDLM